MPPLLADFIHARGCKPKCEKLLTLPDQILYGLIKWGIFQIVVVKNPFSFLLFEY